MVVQGRWGNWSKNEATRKSRDGSIYSDGCGSRGPRAALSGAGRTVIGPLARGRRQRGHLHCPDCAPAHIPAPHTQGPLTACRPARRSPALCSASWCVVAPLGVRGGVRECAAVSVCISTVEQAMQCLCAHNIMRFGAPLCVPISLNAIWCAVALVSTLLLLSTPPNASQRLTGVWLHAQR